MSAESPLEVMADYTRMRKRIADLEYTVGKLRAFTSKLACHTCAGTGYRRDMRSTCEPCGGTGRHADEVTALASQVDLLTQSEIAYLEKIELLRIALLSAERRVAELEGDGLIPRIEEEESRA